MKYINSSFEEINIDEKLCLTIGNFDGIHKGHREIIKNLIQKTKISKSKSAILSFIPHPKIYFKKQNNFMINSQLKKKEILGTDIKSYINSFSIFKQGIATKSFKCFYHSFNSDKKFQVATKLYIDTSMNFSSSSKSVSERY